MDYRLTIFGKLNTLLKEDVFTAKSDVAAKTIADEKVANFKARNTQGVTTTKLERGTNRILTGDKTPFSTTEEIK